MNDEYEKASIVVLSVQQKRAAGQIITDEEVVAAHPQLRDALIPLLRRERRVDSLDVERQTLVPPIIRETDSAMLPSQFAQTYAAPEDAAPEPSAHVSSADPATPTTRATVVQEDQALRATKASPTNNSHDSKNAPTDASEREDRRTQDSERTRPDKANVPSDESPRIAPSGHPADTPHAAPTLAFRPTVRAPMGTLTLWHDDADSFTLYPVMDDRFLIGRTVGDVTIPHDFRMSAKHAELQRRPTQEGFGWFLVDADSTNGTFIRVERVLINDGDEVLLGNERYRFVNRDDVVGLKHLSPDGEKMWTFQSKSAWVGRDYDNLACFQSDPFLDRQHALLRRSRRGWTIQDNHSLNGVWFRVTDVQLLQTCSFQLGEQRFGFTPG